MNFDSLKNLLVSGERKTFERLGEMVELAKKANSVIGTMFSDLDSSHVFSSNEDVRLIEKQGDELSFRIEQEITEGAINPNVIDNLLSCVEVVDGILDDYYFVSRELSRIEKYGHHHRDSETALDLRASFKKMTELGDQALSSLDELLKSSDRKKGEDFRKDIQLLEEEGNNIKDEAFDRLYESSSKLDYLEFNHST